MNKVLSAIRTTLEKQTKALNATEYRITLQNHKKAFLFRNKPLTSTELVEEKRLYILNTKNLVEKLNIYITPISNVFDFYLIDDVSEEALQEIKIKYNICCLMQTSFANFQVILKTEHLDIPTRLKSKYQSQLNKQHGDPDILGHPHAFRLAGFKNVKPLYLDKKTGYFPIVTLIWSRNETCSKAKSELLSLSKSTPITEPTVYNLQTDNLSTSELLKTAQEYYKNMQKNYGEQVDYSRADYSLLKMLASSTDIDIAIDIIRKCSPGLATRHRDIDLYLQTTRANLLQRV